MISNEFITDLCSVIENNGAIKTAIKTALDVEDVSEAALVADTISESTAAAGVTIDGVLLKDSQVAATALGNDADTGQDITVKVTLTATEIVGTAAGDIGHSAGAVLVAAAPAGTVYEFLGATLIYDYNTAAYTGGGDDLVIRVGTTAVTTAVTGTNCLKATADSIVTLKPIATEIVLSPATTINLYGTAYTQPGTAAGVLRVHLKYRKHTTNLA